MNSTEDCHLRLINPVTPNTTSVIKYIEPRSTNITIVPDSALSISPISPLKRSDESINEYDPHQIPTPGRVSFKPLSMAVISRQLSLRKFLQNRL